MILLFFSVGFRMVFYGFCAVSFGFPMVFNGFDGFPMVFYECLVVNMLVA